MLRWIAPTYTAIENVLSNPVYAGAYVCLEKWGRKVEVHNEGSQICTLNMPRSESTSGLKCRTGTELNPKP
jgi:hypothetical protein